MSIKAVVTLFHVSGMDEDNVVNTFHFAGTPTKPVAEALANRIRAFYTSVGTGATRAVGAYLSDSLSRGITPVIRFYDTTVAGVGPFHEDWDLPGLPPAFQAQGLPAEVAACLSYKGGNSRGDAGRRTRGRIYLGPLNIGALDDVEGRVKPADVFLNDVIAAAKTSLGSNLAGDPQWVVHSTFGSAPGSNPPSLQTDTPIDAIWVDDAFDTQRRRGEAPTKRIGSTLVQV